jgi:hypothetical protein
VIIPRVDDWVNCKGKESQGKIFRVDESKKKFTADFFTEAITEEERGGTAEDTLPFSRITEIITNQKEIDQLEEELRGKVAEIVYMDPIYLLRF